MDVSLDATQTRQDHAASVAYTDSPDYTGNVGSRCNHRSANSFSP